MTLLERFLGLIQEESEPIAPWETRSHKNAQNEYQNFVDEITRDRLIAGFVSETR